MIGCLIAGALSAATVKDFGAVGNGSNDDTNAIQSAIDSTAQGGTLTFPAGTYVITSNLTFRSNRTYQGQPGATLKTAMQDFIGVTEYDATSNLIVDGLTFDGGGLIVAGYANPGNNVHITHCTFQNIANGTGNWPAHSGFFVAAGLTGGSTIAYNRFSNIAEPGSMEDVENNYNGSGIVMYNVSQTSVTDNTFDTLYQGITIDYNGGPFPGVVVARNSFNQIHRMGIEMQGNGTQGLLIDSNVFTNWHNPYPGTFGISIAVDGGDHSVIKNNFVSAAPAAYTPTSSYTGYGMGVEIGGTNATVSGNTLANPWGASIAIGTAPNITVDNNTICAFGQANTIIYEVGNQPGAVTSPNSLTSSCPAQAFAIDTIPPAVALTAPANSAVLSGNVNLSATASDNVGVTSVNFIVDGSNQIAASTTAPYSAVLNTAGLANGAHTIGAVAADAAGNRTTTAAVTVTVGNSTATQPVSTGITTTGLAMWLRADKGVTSNAGLVSRWQDQSSNGKDATQPTSAAQPKLIADADNGKPAIRFDGSSSFLGFNLPINGLHGMTIFLVGSDRTNQSGGDSNAQSSAIFWGETAWWGASYVSPFQTDALFRFGTTQVNNLPDYHRPASIGTAYTVTTAVKNGSTDSLFVNGQQVVNQTGKLDTIAASSNSGYIGRGDFNTYFNGDVCEILVYTRTLTDAERQTVEAYLINRNLQ